MKKVKEVIQAPMGETTVLLHTCCAPCSSAIIEAMMQNGITNPVILIVAAIALFDELYNLKERTADE